MLWGWGEAWSSVFPAPRPWTSVLPAAPSSGFPVLVVSRAVCGLCWLCRYHLRAVGGAGEDKREGGGEGEVAGDEVRERGIERE
jgi:hypothetical protein